MIDQALMAIAFALVITCVFLIIDAKCSNKKNDKNE